MPELITIPSGNFQLSGAVHLPTHQASERCGIVLLHENFNTRFGTHRIFFELAEALAEAGFHVLRYDNRGMCDSPGTHEPLTFEDRVADAIAASRHFRGCYVLPALYFWGLCMGGAVALHTASQMTADPPTAMMLCSLLADPRDAMLPQLGFSSNPTRVMEGFRKGGLAKKASRFLHEPTYRRDILRMGRGVLKRLTQRQPELERLQAKIAKVWPLLCAYPGPVVSLFGDKDPCWAHYLSLARPEQEQAATGKGYERKTLIMKDGDHTFSSLLQTRQMIAWSVEWAQALRSGVHACFEENVELRRASAVPAASIAD